MRFKRKGEGRTPTPTKRTYMKQIPYSKPLPQSHRISTPSPPLTSGLAHPPSTKDLSTTCPDLQDLELNSLLYESINLSQEYKDEMDSMNPTSSLNEIIRKHTATATTSPATTKSVNPSNFYGDGIQGSIPSPIKPSTPYVSHDVIPEKKSLNPIQESIIEDIPKIEVLDNVSSKLIDTPNNQNMLPESSRKSNEKSPSLIEPIKATEPSPEEILDTLASALADAHETIGSNLLKALDILKDTQEESQAILQALDQRKKNTERQIEQLMQLRQEKIHQTQEMMQFTHLDGGLLGDLLKEGHSEIGQDEYKTSSNNIVG